MVFGGDLGYCTITKMRQNGAISLSSDGYESSINNYSFETSLGSSYESGVVIL